MNHAKLLLKELQRVKDLLQPCGSISNIDLNYGLDDLVTKDIISLMYRWIDFLRGYALNVKDTFVLLPTLRESMRGDVLTIQFECVENPNIKLDVSFHTLDNVFEFHKTKNNETTVIGEYDYVTEEYNYVHRI